MQSSSTILPCSAGDIKCDVRWLWDMFTLCYPTDELRKEIDRISTPRPFPGAKVWNDFGFSIDTLDELYQRTSGRFFNGIDLFTICLVLYRSRRLKWLDGSVNGQWSGLENSRSWSDAYVSQIKELSRMVISAASAANLLRSPPHFSPLSLSSPRITDQTGVCVLESDFVRKDDLGSGGYGVVFRAEFAGRFSGACAAKRAKPNEDAEMMRQEYQFLRAINHPHIIRVFGYCEQPRFTYFMEEMDLSLHQLILQHVRDRDPLPPHTVLLVAMSVADALAWLHTPGKVRWIMHGRSHSPENRKRIIHRDIKPGNVLLKLSPGTGEIERAVLSLGRTVSTQTDGTSFRGTAAYMAPEIRTSRRPHTHNTPADVWSFGVMLYHMLTGTAPYDVGDLAAIKEGTRPPLPPLPGSVGEDGPVRAVSDVMYRCCVVRESGRITMATAAQRLREAYATHFDFGDDGPIGR